MHQRAQQRVHLRAGEGFIPKLGEELPQEIVVEPGGELGRRVCPGAGNESNNELGQRAQRAVYQHTHLSARSELIAVLGKELP